MALGSAALMFRMEGHGVNGSTSVSKTESLGSNPSAPAKPIAAEPECGDGCQLAQVECSAWEVLREDCNRVSAIDRLYSRIHRGCAR